MPGEIIPPHGGYRNLKSYQTTEIICDATVVFVDRFIDPRSRTRDQMNQAARSGKQNIAEGSMASGTSRKTELKLIGVARASLEELLLDCQDYLRQHGFPIWDKDDPPAQAIRKLAYAPNRSYQTYSVLFRRGLRRSRRQCSPLLDPPGQLPPRPPATPTRTTLPRRRRLHRTPLPRKVRFAQPL